MDNRLVPDYSHTIRRANVNIIFPQTNISHRRFSLLDLSADIYKANNMENQKDFDRGEARWFH